MVLDLLVTIWIIWERQTCPHVLQSARVTWHGETKDAFMNSLTIFQL